MTNEDFDPSVDEAGKLALEIEKLKLEVENLRAKNHWPDRTARYVPLITAFILVAGFCFGIYQFTAQQIANQATAERLRQEELGHCHVSDLGNQLADFYYPIRLRLEMDSSLNKQLKDKQSRPELLREIQERTLLPNLDEINKIILSHAEVLTEDKVLREKGFCVHQQCFDSEIIERNRKTKPSLSNCERRLARGLQSAD